jgi:hypothetical protein
MMRLADIKEELFFALRHPRVRISIAGFVISSLLALAVWAAYWLPIMHAADTVKIKIDERRAEILNAEYRGKLALASSVAAQQVALIEQRLDASVTQGVLVQNIAALARRSKVRVISEAYEEGKLNNGYLPLVHELTVQAGYSELREFLSGLQQLPIFAIVQEADLSRSSSSYNIKAQLNIVTYRRIVEPKT